MSWLLCVLALCNYYSSEIIIYPKRSIRFAGFKVSTHILSSPRDICRYAIFLMLLISRIWDLLTIASLRNSLPRHTGHARIFHQVRSSPYCLLIPASTEDRSFLHWDVAAIAWLRNRQIDERKIANHFGFTDIKVSLDLISPVWISLLKTSSLARLNGRTLHGTVATKNTAIPGFWT